MAKANQVRERNKQKKLERRRRRQKRDKSEAAFLFREPSSKLADRIEEAYELIGDGCFDEAEQLINQLKKRHSRCPAVFEAQLYLCQEMQDIEGCSAAAKHVLKLLPHEPHSRLMYAQASMFCGRVGIAIENYQLFLQRWPDHRDAHKAQAAVGMLKEECEAKIEMMGLDDIVCRILGEEVDSGEISPTETIGTDMIRLGLLRMHDEVLESMQSNNFADAIDKCLRLLELVPNCMSARNNLAICRFQTGNVEKALKCAEETLSLAPKNRFAEACLGKLRFLTGDESGANAIADGLVADPPTDSDPLSATSELLSMLGRDEDIVVLSQAVTAEQFTDPRFEAVFQHHLAVAQWRLGDPKAARESWKKSLRAMPTYSVPAKNLDDLDTGAGHAPWAEPLCKWIPQPVLDRLLDNDRSLKKGDRLNLRQAYPSIAALIPALLDRGDPQGRQLAKSLAVMDGSPEMLDALARFAVGKRGPDDMRFEVLSMLSRKGHIGSGPHRVYRGGTWTDIKLLAAEITWEATSSLDADSELAEAGSEAINRGDFALAEETFNRLLEQNPNNYVAMHNLCAVWIKRDGKAGCQRARIVLEEIHQRFPDYLFANISLAQLAALDSDFERVGKLLAPILDAKRLHVSEALGLFNVQVQVAVQRREFEAAEQAFSMYVQVAGEEDPNVAQLRQRIDSAKSARGFRRLLAWHGS